MSSITISEGSNSAKKDSTKPQRRGSNMSTEPSSSSSSTSSTNTTTQPLHSFEAESPSSTSSTTRYCELHPSSKSSAVFNLSSATLGAGVLTIPYAFSLSGVIGGIIILILASDLTVRTIKIIVESCRMTKLNSFEDLTRELCGRRACAVVEGCLFLFCFGVAVAYVVAVGDILQRGVLDVWGEESYFPGWISREWIMFTFWLGIMFPLSFVEKVGELRFASMVGMGTISFLVVSIVAHWGRGYDHDFGDGVLEVRLWPDSFWDFVRACPIIMFAFSCQPNVCAIYQELDGVDAEEGDDSRSPELAAPSSPTKSENMMSATRMCMVIATTLYILAGTFAYVEFGSFTLDNILENYCVQYTRDQMMITSYVAVVVTIVMAFPLNVFPARATLGGVVDRWKCSGRNSLEGFSEDLIEPMMLEDEEEQSTNNANIEEGHGVLSSHTNRTQHVILTIIVSGGAFVMALLVPDISIVFGLMGGTASSVVCFIFPGLFSLRIMEHYDHDHDNQQGQQDDLGLEWEVESHDEMLEEDFGSDERKRERRRRRMRKKILAWTLILGGTVIGVLSTGVTVYGMFHHDAPPLVCNGSS